MWLIWDFEIFCYKVSPENKPSSPVPPAAPTTKAGPLSGIFPLLFWFMFCVIWRFSMFPGSSSPLKVSSSFLIFLLYLWFWSIFTVFSSILLVMSFYFCSPPEETKASPPTLKSSTEKGSVSSLLSWTFVFWLAVNQVDILLTHIAVMQIRPSPPAVKAEPSPPSQEICPEGNNWCQTCFMIPVSWSLW